MQVTIIANEYYGKRDYEGAVVELPASRFELEEALWRAHVPEDGDYELKMFSNSPMFIRCALTMSGDKTLEELNFLADIISRMNEIQLETYEGVLQLRQDADIDTPIGIKELINYAYNLDSFAFYPGVVKDHDLGEIAMMGGMLDIVDDLPDEVAELLDVAKVGEAVRRADQGVFTRSGYIYCSSADWQEVYDGASLPEWQEEHGLISLRLESVSSIPNENSCVWLELPADEQAVKLALNSLSEDSLDYCTIVEVKSILPSLKYKLADNEEIDKLNTLAKRLSAFPNSKTLMKYKAVLELECQPDVDRMLDITQNLDCYDFDPQIVTTTDYAEYLLREAGFDTDDPAFSGFNFAGYGERQSERNGFVCTPYGAISRNEKSFIQEYTKRSGLTMS